MILFFIFYFLTVTYNHLSFREAASTVNLWFFYLIFPFHLIELHVTVG